MERFRSHLKVALAALLFVACGAADGALEADPSSHDVRPAAPEPGGADLTNPDLLEQAKAFIEGLPLPTQALPSGMTEAAQILATCTEQFGFPIYEPERAQQAGQFFYKVGEQRERFQAVQEACRAAMFDLGVIVPPSPEANEQLYAAYLSVQQCLRDGGFPTVTPPSREAFVENPEIWSPWEAMIERGARVLPSPEIVNSDRYAEYFEALEVCPHP